MNNKVALLLTLLIVTVSGNPATAYFYKEALVILPFAVMFIAAIYVRRTIPLRSVLIIVFFSFIYMVHWVEFGAVTLASSIGMLMRMATALLAARLIPNFAEKYVTVMYGLGMLSLIFFIPSVLGIDISTPLEPFRVPLESGEIHIGLHNFTRELGEFENRNSGIFWEPGAFAGYLTLALLFEIREVKRRPLKYVAVLSAALLSTESTTGYIAFAIVLITFIATHYAKITEVAGRLALGVLAVAFVIGAIIAYSSLDFLSEKIADQFVYGDSGSERSHLTRYGNAIYDLNYILERPFFGWSSVEETRLVALAEIEAQGNGLTGYTLKYGFIGILGFFAFTFQALSYFYRSRRIAIVALAVIAILLVGEQFLNFPLFLTLMFLANGQPAQRPPWRIQQ